MKEKYWVVCRKWDSGELGFFSFGPFIGEVFKRTKKDAERMLKYAESTSDTKEYFLMEVKLKEV